MRYTTEFGGSVSISPPLNAHEIASGAKRGCGAVIAPQPPSARLAPLAGLPAGVARRDL